MKNSLDNELNKYISQLNNEFDKYIDYKDYRFIENLINDMKEFIDTTNCNWEQVIKTFGTPKEVVQEYITIYNDSTNNKHNKIHTRRIKLIIICHFIVLAFFLANVFSLKGEYTSEDPNAYEEYTIQEHN